MFSHRRTIVDMWSKRKNVFENRVYKYTILYDIPILDHRCCYLAFAVAAKISILHGDRIYEILPVYNI